MKTRRSAPGFTLIELVITIAIIGLLAAIAMPTMELVVQRNKEQELRLALREIRTAIDAYKQAYDEGHMLKIVGASGYPPSLRELVDGIPDVLSLQSRKLYFLRRIPRDPFSVDINLEAEQTWGLRSYDSDSDSPVEGKDVFDVYSQATGKGLNKLPYRQW